MRIWNKLVNPPALWGVNLVLVVLVAAIAGLGGLQLTQARATSQNATLEPGSRMTLNCPTRLTVLVSRDKKTVTVRCATATSPTPTKTATSTSVAPTATPTNTSAPPTATLTATPHSHTATPAPSQTPGGAPTQPPSAGQLCPDGVHNADLWHAAVDTSGCYFGHEHGDAPPDWVLSSRWMPMFTHPANTPSENVLKHTGFKAFSLSDDGIDVYVIMHLDTNPNGHTSRFHSYQVWARDNADNVSYWDLWADFGQDNNTGPNLRTCGDDTSIRPIMTVNVPECTINFETWYSRPGAIEWAWDLGFNVKPQYFNGPRKGQASNPDLAAMSTWLPTGMLNDTRRIELAWYSFREHPVGTFYSTQFGDIVSGPNDPLCGTTRTYGSKTYTLLCLEQHIAATMTSFSFPGNAVQKDYDSTGVRLPN